MRPRHSIQSARAEGLNKKQLRLGATVKFQLDEGLKKTVGTACVHDTRSSRPDSHPNCHNSLNIYRIVIQLGGIVRLVSAKRPVFQLDC